MMKQQYLFKVFLLKPKGIGRVMMWAGKGREKTAYVKTCMCKQHVSLSCIMVFSATHCEQFLSSLACCECELFMRSLLHHRETDETPIRLINRSLCGEWDDAN